jgi:hypothetical protein
VSACVCCACIEERPNPGTAAPAQHNTALAVCVCVCVRVATHTLQPAGAAALRGGAAVRHQRQRQVHSRVHPGALAHLCVTDARSMRCAGGSSCAHTGGSLQACAWRARAAAHLRLRVLLPLQANRLGINTVVSTDSIRHMLRRLVVCCWAAAVGGCTACNRDAHTHTHTQYNTLPHLHTPARHTSHCVTHTPQLHQRGGVPAAVGQHLPGWRARAGNHQVRHGACGASVCACACGCLWGVCVAECVCGTHTHTHMRARTA